jgi:hypothetical protein
MYPIYEYLGYCATTNQLLHSLVDCTTILSQINLNNVGLFIQLFEECLGSLTVPALG